MDAEKLLKDKRQAIMALADKHEAHNVRVFGSVARGDSGPESDVDYA
jgi:predicted nucleotidyltransferase